MRTIVLGVWVMGITSITVQAQDKVVDPCGDISKSSNVEMRECYSRQQATANAQADTLATQIAARFRKDARDPVLAGVVAETLRKAATAVAESQRTWRTYRNQHCNAVALSYTTGSGAGTAFEACMLNLGQERIEELEGAFPK